MTCFKCAFYNAHDTDDEFLSVGTCHASPGQLFLVNDKVTTCHPEALGEDPKCERFKPASVGAMNFGTFTKSEGHGIDDASRQ